MSKIDSKLNKVLTIDKSLLKDAKALRQKSIDDAVKLSGGISRKDMHHHTLWKSGEYEVGVGKPGKETERSKSKNPNMNDMWPFIKNGPKFDERSASFSDIFYELEHIGNHSKYYLELLACLFCRSAFMLDHEIVDDKVIYIPPKIVIDEITKDIPSVFGVPLEVFLQYLEAIALNEDVKYQRRLNSNGKSYSNSAGRPNNLLTCAHLIAVMLGRAKMIDFATGFAKQRGVSALSPKQVFKSFPMLEVTKDEIDILES